MSLEGTLNPTNRSGPRVRFVTKRWPHHSTHAGYDRIVHYLGSAVPPVDLERLSSRWIPERVAVRFTRRAGVHQYFLPSFYAEWAAAREMLVRPGKAVYHVLYGDDTYRYLGHVRRWRGHRLVVSYHVPPDDLRERLGHTEHLRLADAIVVVGTNQLPYFVDLCGEERVHYIPHGIDTEVFRPDPHQERQTGPSRGMLFVGSHRRDIETLGEVLRRLEAAAPDVGCVLVTSPEVAGTLEARTNVDVRHRVSEDELIRLYREAAVVLQPMEESTANNSILEALACGTPVVATDVGGVRDYVGDDSAAILTKPRSPEAMVDAVMAIVGDEAERRRMGEAARRQALRFAWPKVAAELSRLYETLS
jgi:glycosyltransferase involved in cell wall biosynthesis